MSGLGFEKWRLGGITPASIAIRTLAIEQSPDAGSEWPIFDLTDPINRGVFRSLQNTSAIEFTSCGSPT